MTSRQELDTERITVSHLQASGSFLGSCRFRLSHGKFFFRSVEHHPLFSSLYDLIRLAFSFNRSLCSHALQTCSRAAQKGPRSGGRKFP